MGELQQIPDTKGEGNRTGETPIPIATSLIF